jgi:hypothetical protein
MRLASATLAGPAAGRWAREELRAREERIADALRAATDHEQSVEILRQRRAHEREMAEAARRRERARREHARRIDQILKGA